MNGPLAGRIALVAGATRGGGRGIAVALGEAGATVYATGRSTARAALRDRPAGDDRGDRRAGDGGGRRGHRRRGRPPRSRRRCARLVERIDADHGRLDVLVNDIWGAEHLFEWNRPVWEHDLERGLRLLRLADRHPPDHRPSRAAAARARPRRPGRRGDRRHRRLQRRPLPGLDVLRPRQDLGDPPRLGAGAGARPPRRHRRGAHPGLDALGADARAPRRRRGELAGGGRAHAALLHLGDAAVRGPRRRRAGRRPRPRALERAVAVQRRAGAGLRLHRPRRHPARLLALHGRGGRARRRAGGDAGYR